MLTKLSTEKTNSSLREFVCKWEIVVGLSYKGLFPDNQVLLVKCVAGHVTISDYW